MWSLHSENLQRRKCDQNTVGLGQNSSEELNKGDSHAQPALSEGQKAGWGLPARITGGMTRWGPRSSVSLEGWFKECMRLGSGGFQLWWTC